MDASKKFLLEIYSHLEMREEHKKKLEEALATIHPVLKKEGFRFILLRTKDKIPFENNWQQLNNYKYDDPKLLEHISNGGNYGIVGGFGKLIVIDFDDVKFQDKIVPLLPKTFTIKTGTGKFHKYFICENATSFKILDKDKNTLADIQGCGKQVVAPNSTHPNGQKYTIFDDSEIANISQNQLQYIFHNYLKQKDKTFGFGSDPTIDQIKSKVKLHDMLQHYGYDLSKNPTMCKLGHTSVSGKCFSYNETDNVWFCFHCESGGDIFNLVMEHENCDFIEAKHKLMKIANIEDKQFTKSDVKPLLMVTNYVENVARYYKICPFFYDKTGCYWLWNKEYCKWEIVDETDVLNNIDQNLNLSGETISSHIKNNYLEAFRRVGRLKAPKDAPKNWVQFKNKIFDCKTKQIFEATPDFFVCNPIPHEIGESDETPIMDKLIVDWVGEELKQTMYEIIAYSTVPDYQMHIIIALVGTGRNGKTTFQQLLCNYIGMSNICSTELDLLLNSRFESCKLYKKLLCVIGETNYGTLQKTSWLKKLTGQDLIGFEFKNKKPFDGYSYAKLLINSNGLPPTEDTTDGFYRRWLVINFTNNFKEGGDILSTIPDIEYKNLSKKICKILPELLKRGEIKNTGTIEDRKKNYDFASNPLPLFIERCCEQSPEYFIRYSEFYIYYIAFLTKHKRRIVGKKEFGQALITEGLEIRKTTKYVDNQYISDRYIEGLKFNKDKEKSFYDNYDKMTLFSTSCLTREKSLKNNDFCHKNSDFSEKETSNALTLSKEAQIEDMTKINFPPLLFPVENQKEARLEVMTNMTQLATQNKNNNITEEVESFRHKSQKIENNALDSSENSENSNLTKNTQNGVIFHKCFYCGLPESNVWSAKGKPMCKYCATNPLLIEDWSTK